MSHETNPDTKRESIYPRHLVGRFDEIAKKLEKTYPESTGPRPERLYFPQLVVQDSNGERWTSQISRELSLERKGCPYVSGLPGMWLPSGSMKNIDSNLATRYIFGRIFQPDQESIVSTVIRVEYNPESRLYECELIQATEQEELDSAHLVLEVFDAEADRQAAIPAAA